MYDRLFDVLYETARADCQRSVDVNQDKIEELHNRRRQLRIKMKSCSERERDRYQNEINDIEEKVRRLVKLNERICDLADKHYD